MLIKGDIDGALVFNITSYFNLVLNRQDPDKDYNWFMFGDYGLDLYSNGMMVSKKLLASNPKAVAGLVRAVNKAVIAVAKDQKAGMKADGQLRQSDQRGSREAPPAVFLRQADRLARDEGDRRRRRQGRPHGPRHRHRGRRLPARPRADARRKCFRANSCRRAPSGNWCIRRTDLLLSPPPAREARGEGSGVGGHRAYSLQSNALKTPTPDPSPPRAGAWEQASPAEHLVTKGPHHGHRNHSHRPVRRPRPRHTRQRRAAARRRPHHLDRAIHRAATGAAHLRHPRFRQRPRPRPPDRVLVRRRRHAAGKLDPALRHRHPARPLPRRRLRDGALGPCRLRRDDDPLHPADRQTAAGRGGQGDRPRRKRCRHPHRLCARGARPEPGGLRRQRTGVVSPLRRGPQRPSRNCSSAPRCRRAITSS